MSRLFPRGGWCSDARSARHYRSPGIANVTELYLDGARVGTTREIVELR